MTHLGILFPLNSAAPGYTFDHAIVLNGADAYLHFTPVTTGNPKTFTLSMWIRVNDQRPGGGAHNALFDAYTDANNRCSLYINMRGGSACTRTRRGSAIRRSNTGRFWRIRLHGCTLA